MITKPIFKINGVSSDFTLLDEIDELTNQYKLFPNIEWNTFHITKFETIYRLYADIIIQYNDINVDRRLMLHIIFTSKESFMHNHASDIAVKLLSGKQEIGLGYSDDRNITPNVVSTMIVEAPSKYVVNSPNLFHYTKPLTDTTVSIALIGERHLSQGSYNKPPLTNEQKQRVLDEVTQILQHDENCKKQRMV